MLTKIITGTQNLGDSAVTTMRGGKQGDGIVSELHGRYYEQTYRGNMYSVCNQAAVTTTGTLATTFTGLAVANPAASGVNLVINKFTCAQFAVGAAAVVGVSVGAGAAAGSLVIRNRRYGYPTSPNTTASAGATIAAPILIATAGSVGSVATTGYGLSASIVLDFEGSLIIPPGYFVASDTSIATTSALIFSFSWEEVPV